MLSGFSSLLLMPITFVSALFAIGGVLILASSLVGFRRTAISAGLALPFVLWGIAAGLESDGFLAGMVRWTDTLGVLEWVTLALIVTAFTAMIFYAIESIALAVAFAPTALFGGLVSGYVLYASRTDIALGIGNAGLIVIGSTLAALIVIVTLIGALRSAPVRVD